MHLAGDTLAVNLKAELEAHGFRVVQPVVYRMLAARAFSEETVEQLATGEIEGVILMSPRTAAVYVNLVRKHGLVATIRPLPHFCLSQAVARRLEPLGSVRTEIAEAPRLEELLALDRGGRCTIGGLARGGRPKRPRYWWISLRRSSELARRAATLCSGPSA